MDSSLGIAFSVFAIVSPLLKVAVCPVPGTFGRAVSTWFASIGRRSARCLAPVGRAVPGTCWGEAVQPGLPALDGWYIRCLAPVAAGWSSLFCQHWAAVYPVPGTCCGGVYPVPGTCWPGGFSLFASIGRRSARCLAPVGRAVDSGARNASTVWRQVATPDRWLPPDRWLTPGASIDALGANR